MSSDSLPAALRDRADIVERSRLDRDAVERALSDLVSSQLVQRAGDTFRYAPASEMVSTIDQLAVMYRTKPVTLVRALYDRPRRAVQSFADAFRLRKPGDSPWASLCTRSARSPASPAPSCWHADSVAHASGCSCGAHSALRASR